MDAVALINQNFLLHAHLLQSLTTGMQVLKTDNLCAADSGLSCDTFNIVYIAKAEGLTREELQTVVDGYREKNAAFCVWINEEQLTDSVRELFAALHLKEAGHDPGMYLPLDRYQIQPVQGDIRIVKTVADLETFARILAANWSPPDEKVLAYYRLVSDVLLQGQTGIELYLYSENNEVVSVMEMFPTDDRTAGLYSLATLEAHRGKGIGTALMKFALNRLKERGFETVILQASEAGLNIYKKLGFIPASMFYEFQ